MSQDYSITLLNGNTFSFLKLSILINSLTNEHIECLAIMSEELKHASTLNYSLNKQNYIDCVQEYLQDYQITHEELRQDLLTLAQHIKSAFNNTTDVFVGSISKSIQPCNNIKHNTSTNNNTTTHTNTNTNTNTFVIRDHELKPKALLYNSNRAPHDSYNSITIVAALANIADMQLPQWLQHSIQHSIQHLP